MIIEQRDIFKKESLRWHLHYLLDILFEHLGVYRPTIGTYLYLYNFLVYHLRVPFLKLIFRKNMFIFCVFTLVSWLQIKNRLLRNECPTVWDVKIWASFLIWWRHCFTATAEAELNWKWPVTHRKDQGGCPLCPSEEGHWWSQIMDLCKYNLCVCVVYFRWVRLDNWSFI